MSLPPQKFREIVFQLLYSIEIGNPNENSMLELIMDQLAVSKKNVKLAQERVHQILEKLAEIDSQIASASTSYEFERIQMVTKNILRLGVYELFYDDSIPPKVAIAEAIRLARKFGSPESATFVNALLDNLYQKSLGKQVDPNVLQQESQHLLQSEELEKKAHEDKNEIS